MSRECVFIAQSNRHVKHHLPYSNYWNSTGQKKKGWDTEYTHTHTQKSSVWDPNRKATDKQVPVFFERKPKTLAVEGEQDLFQQFSLKKIIFKKKKGKSSKRIYIARRKRKKKNCWVSWNNSVGCLLPKNRFFLFPFLFGNKMYKFQHMYIGVGWKSSNHHIHPECPDESKYKRWTSFSLSRLFLLISRQKMSCPPTYPYLFVFFLIFPWKLRIVIIESAGERKKKTNDVEVPCLCNFVFFSERERREREGGEKKTLLIASQTLIGFRDSIARRGALFKRREWFMNGISEGGGELKTVKSSMHYWLVVVVVAS